MSAGRCRRNHLLTFLNERYHIRPGRIRTQEFIPSAPHLSPAPVGRGAIADSWAPKPAVDGDTGTMLVTRIRPELRLKTQAKPDSVIFRLAQPRPDKG